MNEQSKRRLIGGVVVLLVFLITVPLLLNHQTDMKEPQTIPPAPQFMNIDVQGHIDPPRPARAN